MTPSPKDTLDALRGAVTAAWRGEPATVDRLLVAVLCGGHVLIEDVPGVGKTTLASALGAAMGGSVRRVQGTADLLPADLTGGLVLDPRSRELTLREGPLFANVVLADEINRAPPRTQSALLEAMSEAAVTLDGVVRPLPAPFFVLATQNPFDQHGTWPLPESQLDRFLMRLRLGYPRRDDERQILRQGPAPRRAAAVTTPEALVVASRALDDHVVAPAIEDYLLDVVGSSRRDPRLLRGVS
ncbi:MAG TPA: AAA family ATPase, partial [Myxococcota bacterium]|nr:AAA family ATPase [Myxococcota bacterium]